MWKHTNWRVLYWIIECVYNVQHLHNKTKNLYFNSRPLTESIYRLRPLRPELYYKIIDYDPMSP